jgi:hypothetical protein
MKKPTDDDAFEERPSSRRPSRDEEEPSRRKARPPGDEDYSEEGRPRSRRRPQYDEEADEDDRPRRRPRGREDDEPYSTMIPYRNVTALISYYCGMVSLIAILGGIALVMYNPVSPQFVRAISLVVIYGLGGILAIVAIILGIIGMVHANKYPKARGMGHAVTGLVLGIVEVLGLSAILVLGFMATRGFR